MNQTIPTPAIVKEVKAAEDARRIVDSINAFERDVNSVAVSQGIYLDKLTHLDPRLLGYDTIKSLVAGELSVSYETVRRRIRASWWHTVGKIPVDKLAKVSYVRLGTYCDIAEEHGWQEVFDKLVGGISDSDLAAEYGLERSIEEEPERAPQSKHHYPCKRCGYVNEVEI